MRTCFPARSQSLSEELSRESSPIDCLGSFISLLAIKEFGVLVMLPGKLFLPAIRAINEKMATESEEGGDLMKRLVTDLGKERERDCDAQGGGAGFHPSLSALLCSSRTDCFPRARRKRPRQRQRRQQQRRCIIFRPGPPDNRAQGQHTGVHRCEKVVEAQGMTATRADKNRQTDTHAHTNEQTNEES